MIAKKILIALFAFSTLSATAQKNYTMEEAVMGLYTNLKLASTQNLQLVPETNQYSYIKDNQLILKNTKRNKERILYTLDDLKKNKIVDSLDQLKRFPSISWLDATTFQFPYKQQYIKGKLIGKKGIIFSKGMTINPKGAFHDKHTKSAQVAFTIDNNLYLQKSNGHVIRVTNDSNKDIVNGQYVHRREFGITKGTFFSPSGKYLAFYRKDESMVKDYPIIDWSSTPAKNANIKYPMAGDTSHQVTLGIYNTQTGTTHFVKTEGPKDQYLTGITWDPSERFIYIGVLNRAQNHLQFNKYEATTGTFITTLFEEKSDKYVEPQHPLLFLPNKKEFLWMSQRDGFMHIYKYRSDGTFITQLTKGDWIVQKVNGINAKRQEIIINATKEDPKESHIYTVNYVNGKMKKLTKDAGVHYAIVKDNTDQIIDIYSNHTTPKKINIVNTKTGAHKNILTAKNTLSEYNNATVKDVTLKADDGTPLYGKLMLPKNFDPNKKYPVIMYLYNGPHVQLIKNKFPPSGNLWYDLLTQKGFIVFSMDGRGSSNRGLAFENAIHHRLGEVEMNDQLQGVAYLKSLPYVATDRLGVFGWSYGGFMSTSLMTRHPGVFKAAVAGGPVIDWSMYEIMYTERYMGTPQTNPEGFKNNELTARAKDLKGKLLMIHGSDDDVVVWQNSLNFINQCVKEGVSIDYFVYPTHKHNVRGKDRVHLMQKITDYFIQNL